MLLGGASLAAGLAGCLGNEPEPATFTVTVDAPDSVTVDETVTIAWEVTNEGDLEDTQTVVFSVTDEQQASEKVTLAADERANGEFTATPDSEGALPTTVATEDDEASATVLVQQE